MTVLRVETFGSGGAEPYERALRFDDEVLYLRDARSPHAAPSFSMDLSRWNDDADASDLSTLSAATGAVLDIGCGPGRMVKAAMDRGLAALGIDVSPAAVQIAVSAGLSVLRRSVFERLPREGAWQTALLLDGNIGIGGDPVDLLRRCRELLAPDGALVVETHPDRTRDHAYEGTVVDIRGHQSAAFPWAELGREALEQKASLAGFAAGQSWEADERFFSRLAAT
ncbi:MAG: class I SAM-dependent methyltransferase [Leifsonia sp.]